MMKKYLAIAAVSVIGLAGIATAAETVAQSNNRFAKQGLQMHPKGELPRDLQDLNLSAKQKAEIQKIMEANRAQRPDNTQSQAPEGRPDMKRDGQALSEAQRAEFQKKMTERRAAEQNLISAKRFDETAARRMVEDRQAERAQRQQHQTEREIARLKERHGIFQVLTAKQQKQWLENQNKRMEQRGKFRGNRGEQHPQAGQ